MKKWRNSLAWTSGSLSFGLCYILTAQMTYALTESFSISAIYVGIVFLVSRIFDGITDFIAGNIIDRTKSKIGKARFYDLFEIAAWVFVVLCFSVPTELSEVGKIVFVFLMYNLYASVFATFAGCADTVRLKRSLDEEGRLHAVSVSGVIVGVFSAIASIALPIMIAMWGNQPHGWTIISLIFAVPCSLLTLIRFIFLPERDIEEEASEEKIGVLESIKLFFGNKYVILVTLMTLIRGVVVTATASAQTYYFTYVYGDVASASIPGMVSLIAIFSVALMPAMVRKWGNAKTLIYTLALCAASTLLRYIMPTNLAWYTFCTAIFGVTSLPVSYLGPVMLIDAMEYGVWKNGKTPEGVYSSARSIAEKIGLGVGSAVMGIILQIGTLPGGGYTEASIKFLNNGFPAIGWILCIVILLFYDLDKKLPSIREEIKQKSVKKE